MNRPLSTSNQNDDFFPIRQDCPYEFLSHLETMIPEEDIVFRKHVKVVALAVYGYPINTITHKAKYGKATVLKILHSYNEQGFYALVDHRRNYSWEYLIELLDRTARQMGAGISRENLVAWFKAAPHLLPNNLEPRRQYIEAARTETEDYIETTGRETSAHSSIPIGWICGVAVCIALIYGAVMKNPSQPTHNSLPLNRQNAPSQP
jgi:hypothetical protein